MRRLKNLSEEEAHEAHNENRREYYQRFSWIHLKVPKKEVEVIEFLMSMKSPERQKYMLDLIKADMERKKTL